MDQFVPKRKIKIAIILTLAPNFQPKRIGNFQKGIFQPFSYKLKSKVYSILYTIFCQYSKQLPGNGICEFEQRCFFVANRDTGVVTAGGLCEI